MERRGKVAAVLVVLAAMIVVGCGDSGSSGTTQLQFWSYNEPSGAYLPAGYQAACDSALSLRRGFGWGLLAASGLVFVGALVVRRSARADTPPPAAA